MEIDKAFREAAENFKKLSESTELKSQLTLITQKIIQAYKNGGCLFVAGNGGSAADAQHFVAELVAKLSRDRKPIKAFAMTVDTSLLTAIGNDFGYEKIFERQVRGLMSDKDIFLAITTSGNSPNIVEALKSCQKINAKSILLTGEKAGPAVEFADYVIKAPGPNTARIQEAHLLIYHTLCYMMEVGLIEAGLCEYL